MVRNLLNRCPDAGDRRVDEYSRTAGLTVVDILLEIKAIAFSDLRQFFAVQDRNTVTIPFKKRL